MSAFTTKTISSLEIAGLLFRGVLQENAETSAIIKTTLVKILLIVFALSMVLICQTLFLSYAQAARLTLMSMTLYIVFGTLSKNTRFIEK